MLAHFSLCAHFFGTGQTNKLANKQTNRDTAKAISLPLLRMHCDAQGNKHCQACINNCETIVVTITGF